MRDDKDRGNKWLIEHHGGAILRLAGLTGFSAWRARPGEVVHPKSLPDGLLEVTFPGRDRPVLVLVEIATYPERGNLEQAARDLMLVCLDRRTLPEVVTLILHPKGAYRQGGTHEQSSELGLTRLACSWSVVELWEVPAERLLGLNDVGLIPYVPLTRFADPPEAMLQLCRERIEQQAPAGQRANLLAITRVMASLRYNDHRLLDVLMRSQAMLETPMMQEILAQNRRETTQQNLLRFLKGRFGDVPPELAAMVRTIADEHKLETLTELAGQCPDLGAFRAALQS